MASISEAETIRRRQSNESVLGTNAMEGLFPDAATTVLLRRYQQGELTLEQFSTEVDRHARELLAAQKNMAGAA